MSNRPAPAACPILIVDDEPSLRETLAECLLEEGFAVVEAAHGRAALDLIGELRGRTPPCFPVTLLDQDMPVMDGRELVRTLRERGWWVPIIAMTAAHQVRRWANEIAAEGYLAKPFDIDELFTEVRRLQELVHGL